MNMYKVVHFKVKYYITKTSSQKIPYTVMIVNQGTSLRTWLIFINNSRCTPVLSTIFRNIDRLLIKMFHQMKSQLLLL